MSKYFLLPLFLVCTLTSFSQKETKIVVKVSDTTNIIKRLVDSLNERGYTVDQQSDKFVSTRDKAMTNKNIPPTDIRLKAFLKGGQLSFSGEIRMNMKFMGVEPSFEQIEHRGMKKSVYQFAWAEMESVAKQFGDQITYEK